MNKDITRQVKYYLAEDLELLFTHAFKALKVRNSLEEISNNQRVNLSLAVSKQEIDGGNTDISADNIRDYIRYALRDRDAPYAGREYNPRIEAVSRWLLMKIGLNDNDLIEEKTYFDNIIRILKNDSPTPPSKNDPLKELIGTSWWLYCYNDELFNGTTWAGVARFSVEVSALNDVIIGHLDNFFEFSGNSNYNCDYTGAVKMHDTGTGKRFMFELKHNGGRDLHILLHAVDGGVENAAWLTGQFHNVTRSGGKIVSGKILFQNRSKIQHNDSETSSLFYIRDYDNFIRRAKKSNVVTEILERVQSFEMLPSVVRGAFLRKSQSFISVENYSTEAAIEEWNKKEEVTFKHEREIVDYEYEFFISGPATALSEEEYDIFRAKVLTLKDNLESWYNCKGKVYTLFVKESKEEYLDTQNRTKALFEDLVRNLRKSRVFIMLYNDSLIRDNGPSLSGILIEFGFCFYEKKRCLIFWDESKIEYIPNFINGATRSDEARVQLQTFKSDENPLDLGQKRWGRYLRDFRREPSKSD